METPRMRTSFCSSAPAQHSHLMLDGGRSSEGGEEDEGRKWEGGGEDEGRKWEGGERKREASPFSASPFSASPLSASPLSASPLSVSPFSASPLSASPLSASPLSASPLSALSPLSPFRLSPFRLSPFRLSRFHLSPFRLSLFRGMLYNGIKAKGSFSEGKCHFLTPLPFPLASKALPSPPISTSTKPPSLPHPGGMLYDGFKAEGSYSEQQAAGMVRQIVRAVRGRHGAADSLYVLVLNAPCKGSGGSGASGSQARKPPAAGGEDAPRGGCTPGRMHPGEDAPLLAIDFGLSTFFSAVSNAVVPHTWSDAPLLAIGFDLSTIFKPGQRFKKVVGSAYYVAPEALRRDYGSECDVWSIGGVVCATVEHWLE
ncbi:unnamed protein product [Closterium sp. Naga37s-1]|nr:unnamed protein product [Closterium sp. Naga37s-1]